jgi:hypothetical protein
MSSNRHHSSRRRPELVSEASAAGRPGQRATKPEPGILVWDGRSSNLAEFTEHLDVAARKAFPLTFRIINNPDAFLDDTPIDSIAEIAAQVKENSLSDNVERAMLSDRTRRTADARDFRKEEITHYGAIFDKLSEMSQYRVKSSEDFRYFHTECDLRGLWKAIIATHSVGADASDSAAPRLTEEDFNKCRQGPLESALEFYRRLSEKALAMDGITRASMKDKVEEGHYHALELVPDPAASADNPPTATQAAAKKECDRTKAYLHRKHADDLKAALAQTYKSPSELAKNFMARLDPARFAELYTSINPKR